jgi:hypothetical protein
MKSSPSRSAFTRRAGEGSFTRHVGTGEVLSEKHPEYLLKEDDNSYNNDGDEVLGLQSSLTQLSLSTKDRISKQMEEDRARQSFVRAASKAVLSERWQDRTYSSPLKADLLSESERSEADLRARNIEAKLKDQEMSLLSKQAVRNITAGNARPNDAEVRALREQRRLIDVEEKRLKALLQIEKGKLVKKEELLAAKLALKHRREDKLKTRRALFAELQQKRKEQEQVVQKIGMGIEPPPRDLINSLRQLYAPQGSVYVRDARVLAQHAASADEDISNAAAFASATMDAAAETSMATVALATAPLAAENAPVAYIAEVASQARRLSASKSPVVSKR